MQFATAQAFADMVGLPTKLVRRLALEGKLAHIKTGTRHIRIDVQLALVDLDKLATDTAKSAAEDRPRELVTQPLPKRSAKAQLRELYKTRGVI